MKHMRSLANICNAGVGEDAMAKVASQACATVAPSDWPAHPPSPCLVPRPLSPCCCCLDDEEEQKLSRTLAPSME